MIKLKKEKILVSLVIIALLALVVGNVYSLATTPTITAGTGAVNENKNEENTNTNTNSNTNNGGSISAKVGATNNNTNSNKTNTNTNNTANTSKYNNTNNAGKLPYAGTNSSLIFVVIALGVSAIYAYKKVSDYNV